MPPLHGDISILIPPDAGLIQGYIFHYSYSPICWLQQYVSINWKIILHARAGMGAKMASERVQSPDACPPLHDTILTLVSPDTG
jgi:hypothetical protein